MDNATAEYTFVTTFFTPDTLATISPDHQEYHNLPSPALLSPTIADVADPLPKHGSDLERYQNGTDLTKDPESAVQRATAKAEQANSDAIWKQILDPVLEYCQVRVQPRRLSLLIVVTSIVLRSFCPRSRPPSYSAPHDDSSD
jgi:hypothetical protein